MFESAKIQLIHYRVAGLFPYGSIQGHPQAVQFEGMHVRTADVKLAQTEKKRSEFLSSHFIERMC